MKVLKFFKNIVLLPILLFVCLSVNAVEVDQVTQNLILDSIALELVSNPSLKDPVDNLPLGIDFESIEVQGMSIQLDKDDVNIATYTYHVQASFEALDGQVGSILCSAFYIDNHGVKKATKANCMINSATSLPVADDVCEMGDDSCALLDFDDEVLIDEL